MTNIPGRVLIAPSGFKESLFLVSIGLDYCLTLPVSSEGAACAHPGRG